MKLEAHIRVPSFAAGRVIEKGGKTARHLGKTCASGRQGKHRKVLREFHVPEFGLTYKSRTPGPRFGEDCPLFLLRVGCQLLVKAAPLFRPLCGETVS